MALKKSKKEKINIMGEKYKVEKPISDTLKSMAEALRSHEIALLSWVHKDYNSEDNFEKVDVDGFRESLNEYCLNIPEAKNILVKMSDLDKQYIEDVKNKEKKDKNKDQNKEEKESGAKE